MPYLQSPCASKQQDPQRFDVDYAPIAIEIETHVTKIFIVSEFCYLHVLMQIKYSIRGSEFFISLFFIVRSKIRFIREDSDFERREIQNAMQSKTFACIVQFDQNKRLGTCELKLQTLRWRNEGKPMRKKRKYNARKQEFVAQQAGRLKSRSE